MVASRLRAAIPTLGLLLLLSSAFSPSVAADHEYEQSVWFQWNTAELDVLVLGVEDPVVGAAIREAINAWRQGIGELGASWLSSSLVIRDYIPGLDAVPPVGFQPSDVEVFVTPVGFMATQGLPTDLATGRTCYAFAPVGYLAPDPADLEELYFTAAHEFGHCLGLTHVFEHGEEYAPAFDLLGKGSVHPTYGKSCSSNLNLRVIERSFGPLLGQPGGGTVTMAASSYMQSNC